MVVWLRTLAYTLVCKVLHLFEGVRHEICYHLSQLIGSDIGTNDNRELEILVIVAGYFED
jgi:hypothetical protein